MADEDIKKEEVTPEEQKPADELEKLRQELAEAKDKHLRLFAEFDNVRKRHAREREEIIRYAHEEVIVELLGFFEDFERCLDAAQKNPSESATLVKGLEMVMKRMRELLKKYDVEEIDAAEKKFNHEEHEALMAVESPDHEDGTILEVFQKGYKLGGKVVRPAKVKVSKR